MDQVAKNLAEVLERIADAASAAGRDPSEVTLVGVTKYVGAAPAAELAKAGCRYLGENRPQQLWDKADDPAFASLDVDWHMIGHLQRNKVPRTVALSSLIHSVDSERLLAAIDKAAAELGKRQPVLLEVNCSGDSSKHGFTADALKEFVPKLDEFPTVDVLGLMTIASGDRQLSTAADNFRELRTLRDELQQVAPQGVELWELSMGMSGDFEIAIAEGATLVRVGSALWQGVDLPPMG
ncbi:YggS family pyridoxal phosphate-dependent enzyme [Aeoliella mucimassa]|uniref:Pyridoxal phosphate homeostasis protein n=1 Tax=Aeoliella mucimassa TaxID=2527972 RepID=A0A518ALF9_9BACT|nr:YggS family pyridoxal phosphate-dependent enzyme [Aeoliella mucimassa]QDU55570.1 Pyridoxal phosphate homeostasis protein [Aeoliella mucimassa]